MLATSKSGKFRYVQVGNRVFLARVEESGRSDVWQLRLSPNSPACSKEEARELIHVFTGYLVEPHPKAKGPEARRLWAEEQKSRSWRWHL